MAQKKRVKTSRKTKPVKEKSTKIRSTKRKIKLVLRNLIFFVVLSLISLVLYFLSNNAVFRNLFKLLTMLLGFVGAAFLIVLLALWILKLMKK